MGTYTSYFIGFILCIFSCNPKQEKTTPLSFAPKVVEARGYIVPKDSLAEPKVVPVGKPKVVSFGEPKVVFTNTNVHPAGNPRVIIAGVPKVCTPGQEGYSMPKIVPAIEKPFIAGTPEIVLAKEAYTKDQNPQNFSSFGKLQGLTHGNILCLTQDRSGNLWFGTFGGGVSKYDGKNFTHFTGKEGLSGSYVRQILEDKNGIIWFATGGGGVSKYDGKSFTHFTEKEGLSNNDVWSILEDKNGNLWFGTNGGGVSKYDPHPLPTGAVAQTGDSTGGKSFVHFTERQGLSNNTVRSILEDKNGNLWFGTDGGGVSKYDGKSFTHYTDKQGLSNNIVWSILEDKSGNIWFGTLGGGVNKYNASGNAASGDEGKSFTHFTEKEGLSDNNVWSILEDNSGSLWFGTSGGVNKYKDQIFTHFTDKEGLTNNVIRDILQDHSGDLWFATFGGGLCQYKGNKFTHFTEKEGLIYSAVLSILQDKSGNLWFGSFGHGVSKYDGKSFTNYPFKEGLNSNWVNCILEDKNGSLWFGTGLGAYRFDPLIHRSGGKSFTHFAKNEGLSDMGVNSILQVRSGDLWFGTQGDGVFKYTTSGVAASNDASPVDAGKGLPTGTITPASRSGTEDRQAGFTHFTEKEGLYDNNVSSILEDKSGNLWFGGDGLTKYDPFANKTKGNSFTHFTRMEGQISAHINSLLEDKSGNLWIGTYGGGVIKYAASDDAASGDAGKAFIYFTEKEGLSNNIITSILEDKIGNLWFGTRFGLNKLEKNKIAAFAGFTETISSESGFSDYKTERSIYNLNAPGLFKTYMYEDGFSGIGINFGKSIYEAKDGTIWIGADDRLTAFHPGEETPNTIAPNLQLTSLSLFNENIAWQNFETKKDTSFVLTNGVNVHDFHFDDVSRWYGTPEHLSLAYNNNYLTFQFVGITTQAPKKVKYQYKLEGLDKNWSALTNRSEATYGNLSHGKYTFKVKAMNGGGYWSKELAYSFVIRPPWWLTWWARGIYGILLGVAVLLVHRYQKQRIIRIEQEKAQKKELEWGKEIEKAYTNLKATQAQLIQSEKMASLGELTAGIAHEIQNPLNFVNNFSDLNTELIDEMELKIDNGIFMEVKSIAKDIRENEQKINQHGKRADAIVKSMLQHSSISNGQKELTDINALADEYLRLAYHGLRAKDKDFNVSMKTDFDETIDKINIVSQDIGRVLLNLINNAFYAVSERKKQNVEGYEPTVSVSTKKIDNKVLISVKDNGSGIPQKVLDKIFQPFFTTKPTGQGTGLGLSLAYDIVKAHGGSISVNSNYCEPGELKVETATAAIAEVGEGSLTLPGVASAKTGSEFIIQLPMYQT